MDDSASQFVVVGKISSAHGIKGWVNVYSYTDPVTNILQYQPWYLRSSSSPSSSEQPWKPVQIVNSRPQGKQIVAQLEGCQDRNKAELYRGLEIAVERSQLPDLGKDEYYWIELVGLSVVNLAGEMLGVVDSMLATGANDVLVVKGGVADSSTDILIPYVMEEFIHNVDLDNHRITVDWDADF